MNFSNSSEEFLYFSGRNGEILRTYHLILPKFHLNLRKFCVIPPWRIFIFQQAIWNFLRGGSESLVN